MSIKSLPTISYIDWFINGIQTLNLSTSTIILLSIHSNHSLFYSLLIYSSLHSSIPSLYSLYLIHPYIYIFLHSSIPSLYSFYLIPLSIHSYIHSIISIIIFLINILPSTISISLLISHSQHCFLIIISVYSHYVSIPLNISYLSHYSSLSTLSTLSSHPPISYVWIWYHYTLWIDFLWIWSIWFLETLVDIEHQT